MQSAKPVPGIIVSVQEHWVGISIMVCEKNESGMAAHAGGLVQSGLGGQSSGRPRPHPAEGKPVTFFIVLLCI